MAFEEILGEDKRMEIEINTEVGQKDFYQKHGLPFYKYIQQPEHRLQLQAFETRQKHAFMKIIKKYDLLVPDKEDQFALFFTAFLKGEVSSIFDYFYKEKIVANDFRFNRGVQYIKHGQSE